MARPGCQVSQHPTGDAMCHKTSIVAEERSDYAGQKVRQSPFVPPFQSQGGKSDRLTYSIHLFFFRPSNQSPLLFPAEVLALKQDSRILGQWSNPVCGSRKRQASSPWAKQNCSIMEKPHTGLDYCLNMLLTCFRKMMSASKSPDYGRTSSLPHFDGKCVLPL